jgi:hypothetical protein
MVQIVDNRREHRGTAGRRRRFTPAIISSGTTTTAATTVTTKSDETYWTSSTGERVIRSSHITDVTPVPDSTRFAKDAVYEKQRQQIEFLSESLRIKEAEIQELRQRQRRSTYITDTWFSKTATPTRKNSPEASSKVQDVFLSPPRSITKLDETSSLRQQPPKSTESFVNKKSLFQDDSNDTFQTFQEENNTTDQKLIQEMEQLKAQQILKDKEFEALAMENQRLKNEKQEQQTKSEKEREQFEHENLRLKNEVEQHVEKIEALQQTHQLEREQDRAEMAKMKELIRKIQAYVEKLLRRIQRRTEKIARLEHIIKTTRRNNVSNKLPVAEHETGGSDGGATQSTRTGPRKFDPRKLTRRYQNVTNANNGSSPSILESLDSSSHQSTRSKHLPQQSRRSKRDSQHGTIMNAEPTAPTSSTSFPSNKKQRRVIHSEQASSLELLLQTSTDNHDRTVQENLSSRDILQRTINHKDPQKQKSWANTSEKSSFDNAPIQESTSTTLQRPKITYAGMPLVIHNRTHKVRKVRPAKTTTELPENSQEEDFI